MINSHSLLVGRDSLAELSSDCWWFVLVIVSVSYGVKVSRWK